MDRSPTKPFGCFFAAFFGMLSCYTVICLGVLVVDRMGREQPADSDDSFTAPVIQAGAAQPLQEVTSAQIADGRPKDNYLPFANPQAIDYAEATPTTRNEHARVMNHLATRQVARQTAAATSQLGGVDSTGGIIETSTPTEPADMRTAEPASKQGAMNAGAPSSDTPPLASVSDRATYESDRQWLDSLQDVQPNNPVPSGVDIQPGLAALDEQPETGSANVGMELPNISQTTDTAFETGAAAENNRITVPELRISEGQLDLNEMYSDAIRVDALSTEPLAATVPPAEHPLSAPPERALDRLSKTDESESGQIEEPAPDNSESATPATTPSTAIILTDVAQELAKSVDPGLEKIFETARQVAPPESESLGPVVMSMGDTGAARDASRPATGPAPEAETDIQPNGIATSPSRQQQARVQRADKSAVEITGWPLPESLLEELEDWQRFPLTSRWSEAVIEALTQLNDLQMADPDSRILIEYCLQLATQLDQFAESLAGDEIDLASRLSRLSYRLRRRAEVWNTVHQLARSAGVADSVSSPDIVAQAINNRRTLINPDSVSPDWVEYLMLDKTADVFASSRSSELRRQTTARKLLARVTSMSLSEEQRNYAQQLIGPELGTVLRAATTGPLRLGEFLIALESLEAGTSAVADARVNSHFQNFYWSQIPEVQVLAKVFDNHYRNANFRIEVSDRLANRIAPRNMTYHEPVQDRILGAQVLGQSRINNEVHVEFLPDPHNLNFRLVSRGTIRSRTLAHSSGFTFNNLGNARVRASKGIVINPQSVSLQPARVSANSNSRLLGIRSQLDGVPLVGMMARRVAEQQQQSKTPQANSIVEQKLKSEFGSRVDEEVQTKLGQGRQWVADRIINPLNAMELEPVAVNTHTTANTAVIRYRLAGLDQNAANTARPQGLPDSLLNMQIHESAVNNLLNRIRVNGKSFTAPEFMQHVGDLLGREDLATGHEQHDDVKFQFAPSNALRLGFDDDRVIITLRLKRLQIGRTGSWRNLTVTARYQPRAVGLHVNMVLDEEQGVSLTGQRSTGQQLNMRDQLAVRTVFNALFKPQFSFPLLPAELAHRPATRGVAVSQVVLADGWVGISVSDLQPVQPDPAAQRSDRPLLRSARQFRQRWR